MGWICSVCGKKLPYSVFGDAQNHLTLHWGIYAELIHEVDKRNPGAGKFS